MVYAAVVVSGSQKGDNFLVDRVFTGPFNITAVSQYCGRSWAEEPEQWTGYRRFIFFFSPRLALCACFAHGVPVMQASNGEEDDKKIPRTLSAVNKRQRRGYSDHKHVQRQRQNTAITMQTKPMKRGNTDCRLADRKFTVKIMFFDATIGSKNYTICKIQLRNIFPTD